MDYFFTVRGRSGNGYSDRLGPARYLAADPNVGALTREAEIPRTQWFKDVEAEAGTTETENGHIVFFVHGFNTDQWDMLERHRKIRAGLEAHGYRGCVVSFDWPSNGSVLGYSADRRDARLAADKLFTDGIALVSRAQRADCKVNIHVLAHSMGCFLLREAFDYADDSHATAQKSWTVSQIALVAADVSQKSMKPDNPKTSSLLRHCTRLTNYYSGFDQILSVSEVKRIGVSRRLGRVGLPDAHSDKAVNLACGPHYKKRPGEYPMDDMPLSHRWYFDSMPFYQDLMHTFTGNLDRHVIPTRAPTTTGGLALRP